MVEASQATKSFVISAVGLSAVAWDISFNLGAYRTIFFDKILLIWVVSTAILLTAVFLSKKQRPIGKVGMVILTLPSFWLIAQVVVAFVPSFFYVDLAILIIAGIVNLLCLPYIAYILVTVTQGEVLAVLTRKLIYALAAITAIVAAVGYFVGARNDIFLTCQDFKVSGYDLPTNCRHDK